MEEGETLRLKSPTLSIEDAGRLTNYIQENELYTSIDIPGREMCDDTVGLLGAIAMKCRRLRKLRLSGNQIGDAGVFTLLETVKILHRALLHLDLSGNLFHAGSCKALAEVFFSRGAKLDPSREWLMTLDLSDNDLGDEGMMGIAKVLQEQLDGCSHVQVRLMLRNVGCSPHGFIHLMNVLPFLASLDVGINPLSALSLSSLCKVLRESPKVKGARLREIDLSHLQMIEEIRFPLLGNMLSILPLRQFRCAGNRLGPAGAAALARGIQTSEHHSLEWLGLSTNNIGLEGLVKLCEALGRAVEVGRGIRVLALDGNELDDECATRLADLIACSPRLARVLVRNNRIGDAGAVALAAGIKRQLDASSSIVKDHGPLGCLVELDLDKNCVGDEGAMALAGACIHTMSRLHQRPACGGESWALTRQVLRKEVLAFFTGDPGPLQAVNWTSWKPAGLQRLRLQASPLTDQGVDCLAEAVRLRRDLLEHFVKELTALRRKDPSPPMEIIQEMLGDVQLDPPAWLEDLRLKVFANDNRDPRLRGRDENAASRRERRARRRVWPEHPGHRERRRVIWAGEQVRKLQRRPRRSSSSSSSEASDGGGGRPTPALDINAPEGTAQPEDAGSGREGPPRAAFSAVGSAVGTPVPLRRHPQADSGSCIADSTGEPAVFAVDMAQDDLSPQHEAPAADEAKQPRRVPAASWDGAGSGVAAAAAWFTGSVKGIRRSLGAQVDADQPIEDDQQSGTDPMMDRYQSGSEVGSSFAQGARSFHSVEDSVSPAPEVVGSKLASALVAVQEPVHRKATPPRGPYPDGAPRPHSFGGCHDEGSLEEGEAARATWACGAQGSNSPRPEQERRGWSGGGAVVNAAAIMATAMSEARQKMELKEKLHAKEAEVDELKASASGGTGKPPQADMEQLQAAQAEIVRLKAELERLKRRPPSPAPEGGKGRGGAQAEGEAAAATPSSGSQGPPGKGAPPAKGASPAKGAPSKGGKGVPPPKSPSAVSTPTVKGSGKGTPPPMGGKGPGGKGAPPPSAKSKAGRPAPASGAQTPKAKQTAAPKVSSAAETPFGRKIHFVRPLYEPRQEECVWGEITSGGGEEHDIDPELLAALFGAQDRGQSGAKGTERFGSAAKKNAGISIIASNRAQNMAIVLSRLSMTTEGLVACLQTFDFDGFALSVEDIELVTSVLPTAEETKQLLEYKDKADELRDIEQKVLPFCSLAKSLARLKVMRVAVSHSSQHTHLMEKVEIVRNACSELRNSVRLKQLLSAVLKMGNYINAAKTDESSMKGFAVESLPTLATFKSKTGAASSLHFLCLTLRTKSNFVQELHDELQHVHQAGKLKTEHLSRMIDAFDGDRGFLETQCKSFEGQSGHERLVALHKKLVTEVTELKDTQEAMSRAAIDVQRFFNVSAAKGDVMPPIEDFLEPVSGFLEQFTTTWWEIERNPKKWSKYRKEQEREAGPVTRSISATLDNVSDSLTSSSPPLRQQRLSRTGTGAIRKQRLHSGLSAADLTTDSPGGSFTEGRKSIGEGSAAAGAPSEPGACGSSTMASTMEAEAAQNPSEVQGKQQDSPGPDGGKPLQSTPSPPGPSSHGPQPGVHEAEVEALGEVSTTASPGLLVEGGLLRSPGIARADAEANEPFAGIDPSAVGSNDDADSIGPWDSASQVAAATQLRSPHSAEPGAGGAAAPEGADESPSCHIDVARGYESAFSTQASLDRAEKADAVKAALPPPQDVAGATGEGPPVPPPPTSAMVDGGRREPATAAAALAAVAAMDRAIEADAPAPQGRPLCDDYDGSGDGGEYDPARANVVQPRQLPPAPPKPRTSLMVKLDNRFQQIQASEAALAVKVQGETIHEDEAEHEEDDEDGEEPEPESETQETQETPEQQQHRLACQETPERTQSSPLL